MTARRIEVNRVVLTLEGLPVAQAELIAARLEAALAALAPSPSGGGPGWGPAPEETSASSEQPPSPPSPRGGRSDSPAADLDTPLTGPALVDAIAARLAPLLGLIPETPPWP